MAKFDYFTIEPADEAPSVVVYGHGEYEDSSVLAGCPRRVYIDEYCNEESALADYPDADVLGHSSKVHGNPMPLSATSWFDPADAGEAWGEDDY